MIVLLDEHSANVTKMDSVINVINDLYSLLFSILYSLLFSILFSFFFCNHNKNL
jgi:hypothetical protein